MAGKRWTSVSIMPEDHKPFKRLAAENCRSVSGQLHYMIRRFAAGSAGQKK